MHQGVVDWVRATCLPEMIRGKRVLEVGSLYWNGTMRHWFEDQQPAEYVGIDILFGEGVDVALSANDLLTQFGPKRWDLIICLEMLEHCEEWQDAVYQMKESLDEGGWMVVTTRSPLYPFHAPPDHWRFPKDVLREAMSDLEDVGTWSDPGYASQTVPGPTSGVVMGGMYYPQPGVFIRGRRGGPVGMPTVQAEPAPAQEPDTPSARGF